MRGAKTRGGPFVRKSVAQSRREEEKHCLNVRECSGRGVCSMGGDIESEQFKDNMEISHPAATWQRLEQESSQTNRGEE